MPRRSARDIAWSNSNPFFADAILRTEYFLFMEYKRQGRKRKDIFYVAKTVGPVTVIFYIWQTQLLP